MDPLTSDSDGPLIDPQLWHACAGGTAHLPPVSARVVYFPQGHAEHAGSSPLPEFPPSLPIDCAVPCRVVSVAYLADKETDEVFARIALQPELPPFTPATAAAAADSDQEPLPSAPALSSVEKPTFFAKTLTQSDANNGGGFSVPRYCAEMIFPPLDYSADPPVQNVEAKDVHGETWKFRHIYRGTPRRHLLTTGWSSFVNQKKLVAGDSIVFLLSSSNGELCVGVRRSNRGGGGGSVSSDSWHQAGPTASAIHLSGRMPARWETKIPDSSPYDFMGGVPPNGRAPPLRPPPPCNTSSARNRARITAASVIDAATKAAARKPFEVTYYPRSSIFVFCVQYHTVQSALQRNWAPGMRFKMPVETEDSSRTSWFMGTISKVEEVDPVRWPKSPWKMLQVIWDEPDLLQGISRVSPWQIELVSPMQIPPYSLPKKKVRMSQPMDLQLVDGQGMMGITMAAVANNVLGQMSPWHHGFADNNNIPAGMQGARHENNIGIAFQELRPQQGGGSATANFFPSQDYFGLARPRVSTELKMSLTSQPEHRILLPNYLMDWNSVGGLAKAESIPISNGGNAATKRPLPFLLFGKAIDPTQSTKQQLSYSGGSLLDGISHENGSNGNHSEGAAVKVQKLPPELKRDASELATEDTVPHCKLFREDEEVGRTIDLLLFSSYQELFERLAKMLSINEAEIMKHMVYLNSNNIARRVGEEPYRIFARQAKRLKILSPLNLKKESNDNEMMIQLQASSSDHRRAVQSGSQQGIMYHAI